MSKKRKQAKLVMLLEKKKITNKAFDVAFVVIT